MNATIPGYRSLRRLLFPIFLFIIVYVLLGNARSVSENPLMPGAALSVNRIVPVLAGVLLGPIAGAVVGLCGTALNALSPAGTYFEWLSILPHAAMGLIAGLLARTVPTPLPMLSIYAGAALQLGAFWLVGELSWLEMTRPPFVWRFLSDGLIGIMAALVLAAIYRITAASMRV